MEEWFGVATAPVNDPEVESQWCLNCNFFIGIRDPPAWDGARAGMNQDEWKCVGPVPSPPPLLEGTQW